MRLRKSARELGKDQGEVPRLVEQDKAVFAGFCERAKTVGRTRDEADIGEMAIRLRRETKPRIPDGIVAATAIARGAISVTADRHFQKVPGPQVSNLP